MATGSAQNATPLNSLNSFIEFCVGFSYNSRMRLLFSSLFVFHAVAAFLLAGEAPLPRLPETEYEDGEVCTNAPIAIPNGGEFSVMLTFPVSVTNSFELLLGYGGDGHDLAPEEAQLQIGWECGRWFAASPSSPVRLTAYPSWTNGLCELSFGLRVSRNRGLRTLWAREGDRPLWSGMTVLLPQGAAVTNWNTVCLVARGHLRDSEAVTVRTSNDGTLLIMR